MAIWTWIGNQLACFQSNGRLPVFLITELRSLDVYHYLVPLFAGFIALSLGLTWIISSAVLLAIPELLYLMNEQCFLVAYLAGIY
jgi:hypothetical protein